MADGHAGFLGRLARQRLDEGYLLGCECLGATSSLLVAQELDDARLEFEGLFLKRDEAVLMLQPAITPVPDTGWMKAKPVRDLWVATARRHLQDEAGALSKLLRSRAVRLEPF